MRRFRFSLQRVHKLRQHRERASRVALAEELSRLAELEERRSWITENLTACRGDFPGRKMVSFVQAIERGLAHVCRRLDGDIEQAEGQVESARIVYQEHRQALLATGKLRELRAARWRREAEAEAQANFDEMARIRFTARRNEI